MRVNNWVNITILYTNIDKKTFKKKKKITAKNVAYKNFFFKSL